MVKYLASGKIIVNNKGKAVKQYEPWYSTTREFEDEDLLTNYGVTPIMHYDPLSRLIQTDFPDNTITKVTFDVWQQKNYDQNDCDTSSAHYNTPQVLDLDVLGRAFQMIDDNGTFGLVTTHNQLDITGRILVVTDALGRTATQNKYALSEKHQIYVKNIDSGERWMLNDTVGNPRYVWDSRNHRIKTLYDTLLRPTQTLLKTANNPEITTQQIIYGTSSVLNNILQIIEIDAQDGKTSFEYDFKGNVSKQTKQFAQDYQNKLDWNGTVALNNEIFATQTTYDALNRPVTVTQPDNSVIAYTYDKGGLLQSVALTGSATASIQNITYNSKGQREDIYYGNNTKTKYYYHPLNFRITRILTTRNSGQDILQDLNYIYDAVGNITQVTDNAQQTYYFNNQVIAPIGTYIYDALYRLIQATGRELTALQMPTHDDFPNNIPCPNTAGNAMQNYTQQYSYDELGNMLQMQSVGNWTRDYVYNNPMTNNYLLRHGSGTVYTYDAHGNMLTMPHLTSMVWDYKDELVSVENGMYYYSARYYAPPTFISRDPLFEKYPFMSPYTYCANNPVILVDPDGRDWYEAENGKITWTNYTSQKDLDDNKIKGTYLGQAHVVFDGSRWEKPSIRNGKKYITGEGAINASVTVYGPKGADDIHNFTGYTMTSDPEKFIPIDEGLYSLNYMNPGKGGPLSSHWAVNGTGIVPTMDGMPNKNPDAKGNWNFNTPWKTGIYVHSTNSNGGLGLSVSTGCLLILDSQWNDFNDVMQGVKRSSVRVTRTDFQVAPLKGVTGIIPYKYIIQKIKRR
jgi:RHS repeat-associated protein